MHNPLHFGEGGYEQVVMSWMARKLCGGFESLKLVFKLTD